MLPFHPPALRRDPPPDEAKSLTFDLLILVLTAILITASLCFFAGNGSTTGDDSREQTPKQSIENAKPYAPAHPGRTW
jgi:hypothetical protein